MKAQGVDAFYFLGSAIGGAIAIILLVAVFTQLFGAFKTNPQVAADPVAVNALTAGQNAINIFPDALVIVSVFIAIASMILSFFSDSAPVFAIVVFILLPIEMLVAFIGHDVFFAIISSPFLASTAAQFPPLVTFMAYLAPIVLVLAVINSIVVYSKR